MCFTNVVISYDGKQPAIRRSLWDLVSGFIASINPLAKSCITKGGSTIIDAYCQYCSPEIVAERTRLKAARANGTLYSPESQAAAKIFEAGRMAAAYDHLKDIWAMQEDNAPYSIPTKEEAAVDKADARSKASAAMMEYAKAKKEEARGRAESERLKAEAAKAKAKKLEYAKQMGWEIINRW